MKGEIKEEAAVIDIIEVAAVKDVVVGGEGVKD